MSAENTALEDAQRVLLEVRQQFDATHHEAEKKEAALKEVREAIRAADATHGERMKEVERLEDWGGQAHVRPHSWLDHVCCVQPVRVFDAVCALTIFFFS